MLESIRRHSKIGMFVLLILIVPAFVFVGVGNRFTESSKTIAKVGDKKITQAEWDFFVENRMRNLQAQNSDFDSKIFDDPKVRYSLLENIIRDLVLSQTAQKMRIITSEKTLVKAIMDSEEFSQFKKEDGTLDVEGYKNLLSIYGLTPATFENNFRGRLSLEKVLSGVAKTSFTSESLTNLNMDIFTQQREVELLRFEPENYKSQIKFEDKDLENFYTNNLDKFQQEENLDIEYLVLDAKDIKEKVQIKESEIQKYFEDNQAEFTIPEKRFASHILINLPENSIKEEELKIKDKAEKILAEIKENPKNFSEIAKKESQDLGSAENGGDLGQIDKGVMVEEFEKKVFELNENEISDLVKTQFGFHIIKLTKLETEKLQNFEEVKIKIEENLKTLQAENQFAELSEKFANSLYEQDDSLEFTAQDLNLEIQKAESVKRNNEDKEFNSKFIEALFSNDSLDKKLNTEAIDISEEGNKKMIAGRVVKHNLAKTLDFSEVKNEAQELFIQEEAIKLATQEGEKKLTELQKEEVDKIEKLAEPESISRINAFMGFDAKLIDKIMEAQNLPVIVGLSLADNSFAIAKINKILPSDSQGIYTPEMKTAQYKQIWQDAEQKSYYDFLKKQAKVEIKIPKP